jgi:adenosylmethionine-8-amino-7-oxononanoate aminotransferase
MPYRDEFGPLVEDTSQIPWDSLEALEAELARVGPDNVAAFVFEPVIGSGGVLIPPRGYLEAAEQLCRRHGVLTIADVVICGFGRLGAWLGVERFGLRPDLIVFAKGVTSGYLPLGGVIVAPQVAEPFWREHDRSFAHGNTYSGHATCCAAALANLDLLESEGLVQRAADLEGEFHRRLRRLEAHPRVREVRGGIGLMAAVAVDEDPAGLWRGAREHGLLTRLLPDGVAIAPPLTVELHQIDEITEALDSALSGPTQSGTARLLSREESGSEGGRLTIARSAPRRDGRGPV